MQATLRYVSEHARPIEVKQANLREKPVAVVYNPTSGGGKIDIRAQIESVLT